MIDGLLIAVGLKSAPTMGQIILSSTWFKTAAGLGTVYGAHVGVQKVKMEGKVKVAEPVIEASSEMKQTKLDAQKLCDEAWAEYDRREKERKRQVAEKKAALKAAKKAERQRLKTEGKGIKWFPKFGSTSKELEVTKPAKKSKPAKSVKPATTKTADATA